MGPRIASRRCRRPDGRGVLLCTSGPSRFVTAVAGRFGPFLASSKERRGLRRRRPLARPLLFRSARKGGATMDAQAALRIEERTTDGGEPETDLPAQFLPGSSPYPSLPSEYK